MNDPRWDPISGLCLFDGDFVCEEIRQGRGWDNWILPVLDKYLFPAATAVDVGAHVGWISLEMLKRGIGMLYAVEPQAPLANALARNIGGHGTRVVIYPVAAGEMHGLAEIRPQEQQLTVVKENYHQMHSPGSIAFRPLPPGASVVQKPMVPMVPLDFYLQRGPRVDFVKIDAQGMDFSAMLGMKQTLTRDRPPVVFEWETELAGLQGHSFEMVKNWLRELRYHVDQIEGGAMNFLALPEERG